MLCRTHVCLDGFQYPQHLTGQCTRSHAPGCPFLGVLLVNFDMQLARMFEETRQLPEFQVIAPLTMALVLLAPCPVTIPDGVARECASPFKRIRGPECGAVRAIPMAGLGCLHNVLKI